jgi:hypothetical protein
MRAAALGLALTAVIIACGSRPAMVEPPYIHRQHMLDKMDQRLSEIRQWRHERGMGIEPSSVDLLAAQKATVRQAKNVCPDNHAVPKSCSDICILSDDICDNAEAICAIADELGKDDKEGQDRCASGKASCHEAKQRCCDCAATETP